RRAAAGAGHQDREAHSAGAARDLRGLARRSRGFTRLDQVTSEKAEDSMSTPRPGPGGRPPGWQQAHAKRYIETEGREGHIWEGVTTLLLTTTGRRSGQPRTTPLIYGRAGDQYLVVASRGGAPAHPSWYENLV